MPERDGFETTASIRSDERATGRHTPIIALTAHAMAGVQCGGSLAVDRLEFLVNLGAVADLLVEVRSARAGPESSLTADPRDWHCLADRRCLDIAR